jgi:hypothetical protein
MGKRVKKKEEKKHGSGTCRLSEMFMPDTTTNILNSIRLNNFYAKR